MYTDKTHKHREMNVADVQRNRDNNCAREIKSLKNVRSTKQYI